MSDARRQAMIADRHLRDSAKAIVEADWANVKADMQRRSIGGRALDRISEGASDVYEEALNVAADHKGALAAIVAALVMWFARNPIMDTLFGPSSDEADEEFAE